MPAPDATVSEGVRDLFRVARQLGGQFPALLGSEFAQEMQELEEDILGIEDDPLCTKVEMGETCGERRSRHFSLTHAFEHNAAVAQPAEQVLRKDEVGGSTPSSSSTFSDRERELMAEVVKRTNVVLKADQTIKELKEKLAKTNEDHRKAALALQANIEQLEKERVHVFIEMGAAEHKFRTAMIESAIVQPGVPVGGVTGPAPIVDDEPLDIGRGE